MESQALSPLQQIIIDKMKQREENSIPFHEYMALCLYEPTYGYYRRDAIKIGKEGDFYTSSSIGTVMGKIMARAIAKHCGQFDESPLIQLVEWGGGNGRLARHLLDELRTIAPQWYERVRWIAVEESRYHLQLQKKELAEHKDKVQLFASEDRANIDYDLPVIVIANELLDAFPVSRIRYTGKQFQESYVTWEGANNQFVERWVPIRDERLIKYVDKYADLFHENQRADIQLDAAEWLSQIGRQINQGMMIVIDYGDVAEELFAAHRMEGTLLCYRNHQAHDNPFIHPGEQDITAHVNFTDLLEAAENAGFTYIQLRTQKQFLVDEGIMELLVDHYSPDPFSEEARMNRAVRQLLLSDQMSELFKVLLVKKKI